MRDKVLVFGQPAIGEDEIAAVVETMRSKWIGTGPRVERFQSAFARHTGSAHAVAVSSCTAALHLVMDAAGIGAGDEVITSPMTFCATANAILHTGARPVFADCDPRTGNILPQAIEDAITQRTRAIVPIHLSGRPCEMDAIMAIADRHGLLVLEDCAHAIEARSQGRPCGTIGRAGAFSFYATKNITSIEGGMIVTNDKALADKARVLSLHGMSKDAWRRYSDQGFLHYTVSACGYKYNMTDVQASIALVQLAKLDAMYRRREAIWARYERELADLPLLLPPLVRDGDVHARHLFSPLLDLDAAGVTRDQLMQKLLEQRIGTGVHYLALHRHPLYQQLGYRDGQFPGAEFMSDRTLSLPLSPALSDQDVTDVVEAMHAVLGAFV